MCGETKRPVEPVEESPFRRAIYVPCGTTLELSIGLPARYEGRVSGAPSQFKERASGWFNNRRLLEPIENAPPAEFEELYNQS